MRLHKRTTRGGFTLIELLVVIFIILVLMGLLTAAAMRVYALMDEAAVRSEIDRMDQAAEEFRTSLGRYPPGRIRLIEEPTAAVYYDVANNPFDEFSVSYLEALFPGIYICRGAPSPSNPVHRHNWDGSVDASGNPTVVPGAQFVLEGDECLVYFLGGIPIIDASGVVHGSGFSTDKTNPTLPALGRNRIGPFFEFKSDRLFLTTRRLNNRFAVYLDVWRTPYVYFQARYGSQNNYPCVAATPLPLPVPPPQNDCPTATGYFAVPQIHFTPYCKSVSPLGGTNFVTFHKTDKFQIISAGRDGLFGVGGAFDPSNPEVSLVNRFDRDNLTNFHSGQLAPK